MDKPLDGDSLHAAGSAPVVGAAAGAVALDFMVVPELLATLAYVPDPVRCKVVDADAIFLTGILGESGRRLVRAGIEFYFTRSLAEKLIRAGIAVEAQNARMSDAPLQPSDSPSACKARSTPSAGSANCKRRVRNEAERGEGLE